MSHFFYVFFYYANSENGKLSPWMVFVQVSLKLVQSLKEMRVCLCVGIQVMPKQIDLKTWQTCRNKSIIRKTNYWCVVTGRIYLYYKREWKRTKYKGLCMWQKLCVFDVGFRLRWNYSIKKILIRAIWRSFDFLVDRK